MLLKFGSVFVSFFIATMGLVFSSSVGISGIKMTRCWDFHRTVICTHIYGLHSTYAYILQDSQKESRMIVQLFYNLHQTRKIIIKVKKRISFRVLSREILYQGLFLDILKKTQTQKNSKLKPNPEKTQGKSPKNSKSANSTRVQMPESMSSKLLRTYNLWNSSFFQWKSKIHSLLLIKIICSNE